MFGKISKLALGMSLIGGVMSGNCEASEVESIPQDVTMIIKSFTDSLEFRKPTRVFISLIGSLSTINPELNKLSSTSKPPANRQFFIALHQILSVPGFKVSDESVTAILKSAEEGCEDAAEMVNATFGKESSEMTDRKAFLKKHMQEVLDESASDSDESSMDSEGKDMDEEKNGKLVEDMSEENFGESDDNYPFEQLQEHMFLGIKSYLRDTSDSDAKTIIKGTLKRMLSHREGHTDEELLEEILPLNEYEESRGLYHELQTMIMAGK